MKLSEDLKKCRTDRPDEWTIGRWIRKAKDLEAQVAELTNERDSYWSVELDKAGKAIAHKDKVIEVLADQSAEAHNRYYKSTDCDVTILPIALIKWAEAKAKEVE